MPAPIRCPRCLQVMENLACGPITIDRCPLCAGIWLDHGELTRLRRAEDFARTVDVGPARAARLRHVVGAMRCPRDQRPLEHTADVHQRHIRIEHCFFCRGVFLDAGELIDVTDVTLREWLRGLRL